MKICHPIVLLFVILIPCIDVCGESFTGADPDGVQVRDSWFAKDKAQHLVASFMLTGAIMYRFRYHERWNAEDSRVAGAGVTLGIGILKEWRDLFKPAPYNRFSWKDLAADLAGICLGILLLEWW